MEQKNHASREFTLSNEAIVALIRKIEGGDSSALILLYDATNRLVFGLIMRILRDRTSAEETLLDVYTQVWKQSTPLDPEIQALEWLLTLARMSALTRLYWSKRDNRKQEMAADASGSAMTVSSEQQKAARSSMQSLASAQRELLEWAYYGGMSYSEMAAQAGKPLGAVKSHIRIGLSDFGARIRHTGKVTGGHLEARKSD